MQAQCTVDGLVFLPLSLRMRCVPDIIFTIQENDNEKTFGNDFNTCNVFRNDKLFPIPPDAFRGL